ncbi:branched-chain amino acid aminotransferase [Parvularcula bermudensis HTCC2503]|uniref:Branched-chain-amino-acid aminotransferase n=1 Tax=Parvularcula bermudensis (strain ATCC BAA-594 / HTCC2503 / KCTC 12087) TaxID=314260 RepID=E0TDR9_PARBH|nr:branched-chain amino acid transaminase [Parvularcula bermudensis]ADM09985.1 branched-chain amino acid aminotransferase [Parvularcula bermudensis HTCC2503]
MPIQEADFIWKNGELIPWAEATTHVLTHALLYGTCAFEGSRAYQTHKGTCIFRTAAHVERLIYSSKIYHIPVPYTADEIIEATRRTVRENNLPEAYIRTNVYLGYGEMSPAAVNAPTDVTIAAFPWGRYMGADAIEQGVPAAISSWRRLAPSTMPAGAKLAGNYLSSRLIALEARRAGVTEGIGLTAEGMVSEAGSANLFVVKGGRLITPPVAASILNGITRDTVITLAKDQGIDVVEQEMPRELLYGADELFFTGTAAEITPINRVDGLPVGPASGENARPITGALQKAFFGLFTGETSDKWGWLDPVEA